MPTPLPTLDTVRAADGSNIKVTTRIDRDGLLRIDTYRSDDKKNPVCSGVTKPADATTAALVESPGLGWRRVLDGPQEGTLVDFGTAPVSVGDFVRIPVEGTEEWVLLGGCWEPARRWRCYNVTAAGLTEAR